MHYFLHLESLATKKEKKNQLNNSNKKLLQDNGCNFLIPVTYLFYTE